MGGAAGVVKRKRNFDFRERGGDGELGWVNTEKEVMDGRERRRRGFLLSAFCLLDCQKVPKLLLDQKRAKKSADEGQRRVADMAASTEMARFATAGILHSTGLSC